MMFVSRSQHTAALRLLELSSEQKEAMYQNQIRRLESHIEDLRRLVFTPATLEPTPEMREVDQVLTPVNDSPIMDFNQEADEAVREQNKIFAGEWEGALE